MMFEFLATLSILVFGAMIGFLFGEFESDRVTQRFRDPVIKKLPHGKLLIARVIICLLASYMVTEISWNTVVMATAMMMSLTATHRYTFNKGVLKPYWYMGPPLDHRSEGDSRYDTAMHLIASFLHIFNRKAPFWIATSLEVITAWALLYIFFTL